MTLGHSRLLRSREMFPSPSVDSGVEVVLGLLARDRMRVIGFSSLGYRSLENIQSQALLQREDSLSIIGFL